MHEGGCVGEKNFALHAKNLLHSLYGFVSQWKCRTIFTVLVVTINKLKIKHLDSSQSKTTPSIAACQINIEFMSLHSFSNWQQTLTVTLEYK